MEDDEKKLEERKADDNESNTVIPEPNQTKKIEESPTPDGRQTHSSRVRHPIFPDESCSLATLVVGSTSERSVHWRRNFLGGLLPPLPRKDFEREETPDNGSQQRRPSVDSIRQLEEGCTELQQQLRVEVRRVTSKALLGGEGRDACDAHADLVRELRRGNAALQRQLQHLRQVNRPESESAAERLHDIQAENKELQERVSRLEDEVGERRAAHGRDLQRRMTELRRLVYQCAASRESVHRLRAGNAALRQRAEEAERARRSSSGSSGSADRRQPGVQPGVQPLAAVPVVDLQVKLEKARLRLQRTEMELSEKRRHRKKVTSSVDSLEELRDLWSDHVALLEKLQCRESKWRLLRDRVDMYARNIEILRAENAELTAQLDDVHAKLTAFVEQPMTPTAFVEKNVALLKHMEKIEATLAEKAIELDEQENELKLEQNKVRELLITLEDLRRENRHLSRRLQKAESEQETAPTDANGYSTTLGAERPTPLGSQNLSAYLLPMHDKEHLDDQQEVDENEAALEDTSEDMLEESLNRNHSESRSTERHDGDAELPRTVQGKDEEGDEGSHKSRAKDA